MASLKLTALVQSIKGNISGTTFQGGISGQVARTKPKTASNQVWKWSYNKGGSYYGCQRQSNNTLALTASQATDNPAALGEVFFDGTRNPFVGAANQQNIIANLSSEWRTLSESDRASWTAGAVNYPFHNKHGEEYTGSGYQVFMQLNTNLLQAFQPILTSCPIPVISVLPTVETNWNDEYKESLMLLEFPDGIAEGMLIQVFATPMRSVGRTSSLNAALIASISEGAAVNVPLIRAYEMAKGAVKENAAIMFIVKAINLSTGLQQTILARKLKVVFGGRGQVIMSEDPQARAWVPTGFVRTIDMGSVAMGDDTTLEYLLYGLQFLDSWSITLGGANAGDFDFFFNDVAAVAGVVSGGCDAWGNMIGVRITPIFAPLGLGVRTATLTISVPNIPFTEVLTITGTGTV